MKLKYKRNTNYKRQKKREEAKVTRLKNTKLEEEVEEEYNKLGLNYPAKTLEAAEERIKDRKSDLSQLKELEKVSILDSNYNLKLRDLASHYESGGNYLSAAILYSRAGKTTYAAVIYNETVRILEQYGDYLTAAVILWKESNSPQKAIKLLSDKGFYKPALEIAKEIKDEGTVKVLKEKINEEQTARKRSPRKKVR